MSSMPAPQPVALYGLVRPDRAALACVRAYLFGTGPGTSIALEAGGFGRSRAGLDVPDLQITFIPGLTLDVTRKKQGRHGFLTHCYQLRPESRGEVRIDAADPQRAPAIHANTLAAETDRRVVRDAVRFARRIMAQAPFDPYRGAEIAPGADAQSDEAIDAWIRANLTTVWHPVGTCRMGTDENAVVDARLRLRGAQGLRVVDASVMPVITSSNTAAPHHHDRGEGGRHDLGQAAASRRGSRRRLIPHGTRRGLPRLRGLQGGAMAAPRSTSTAPLVGVLYMCVAAGFGLPGLNALVKLLIADYHMAQIIWFRCVVHLGFMVALFMPAMGFRLFASRRPWLQSVRSLTQLVTFTLIWVSLFWTPITTVTMVLFTGPLILVALSVPFLGERVGPRRWAAVFIGFAGVLIVLRPRR